MITLFIFYLHLIAAVWVFTSRWQRSGIKEAFLATVFITLLFSVGWSISTVIMKLVIEEKGFGFWLDRDTMSLLLLTIIEGVFYYVQYVRKQRRPILHQRG